MTSITSRWPRESAPGEFQPIFKNFIKRKDGVDKRFVLCAKDRCDLTVSERPNRTSKEKQNTECFSLMRSAIYHFIQQLNKEFRFKDILQQCCSGKVSEATASYSYAPFTSLISPTACSLFPLVRSIWPNRSQTAMMSWMGSQNKIPHGVRASLCTIYTP